MRHLLQSREYSEKGLDKQVSSTSLTGTWVNADLGLKLYNAWRVTQGGFGRKVHGGHGSMSRI